MCEDKRHVVWILKLRKIHRILLSIYLSLFLFFLFLHTHYTYVCCIYLCMLLIFLLVSLSEYIFSVLLFFFFFYRFSGITQTVCNRRCISNTMRFLMFFIYEGTYQRHTAKVDKYIYLFMYVPIYSVCILYIYS